MTDFDSLPRQIVDAAMLKIEEYELTRDRDTIMALVTMYQLGCTETLEFINGEVAQL